MHTGLLCSVTCWYVSTFGDQSAHVSSWWRHQMETFSALLAICAGNSPVPGEFPAQRPVTRSFDVFFCVSINGWVNNRGAGDLRRHRAHYDVTLLLGLHPKHWCNRIRMALLPVKKPRDWFNIKISCYQYKNFHCRGKTISSPHYLHNGIHCTDKTAFLYLIRVLEGQR